MSEQREAACLDDLVEENLLALYQLQEFLQALAPSDYRQPFGPLGRQSLGKHVRHIIDHYDALLAGIAVGDIDYEARRRDPRLETEPMQAVARVADLSEALQRLGACRSDRLRISYPIEGASDSLSLVTSLARELAFMTSHTVHHMALLGFMAEQLGMVLPDDFGVHPSTLRFWQKQAVEENQTRRQMA